MTSSEFGRGRFGTRGLRMATHASGWHDLGLIEGRERCAKRAALFVCSGIILFLTSDGFGPILQASTRFSGLHAVMTRLTRRMSMT